MNWLDIVIIGIVIVFTYLGMKRGLIGAAIAAVAVLVGWQLAGQFGDNIGELFEDSVNNDTLVTVISYAIIVGVSVVVGGIVGKIVKPFLTVATLGLSSMADKLGGVGLGIVVGIALSWALITVMARFAYNFELPEAGVAGAIAKKIPEVEDKRTKVEDALTGSALVPVFVDITDALPADAFGYVPSDFKAAFDILQQKIDEED